MNENEKSPQQNPNVPSFHTDELSAAWQELLGWRASKVMPEGTNSEDMGIPTLESDPWSTLIQAKGVEIVDLDKTHLHLSAQEVEQMLRLMQEQSTQQGDEGLSS
ncbi:hypothetical protein [Dictyobacter arantiisoli]|uniref:Uncharacterized protein n=1 Tax=Dictyobacter arantiisoli TaxID=2014874 RepID=A0A5A5TAV8_9CHLR|nr:hypothetical protein [Dictyobacter arantiisoli]GCF08296.1 hypothetical protein KDI_18600 [Dictyobacter arantiisoli]